MKYFIFASGMQVKFVGDDSFMFCYGERGTRWKDKSSILLIHGFTASKDQWLALFKKLPKDLHLIAVDLPGHGSTSTPKDEDDVSLSSLVDLLHKFVNLSGLAEQPFHVVGTSLGGVIGGLYTAKYNSYVDRLTMVCPAMKTPVDSEFSKQMLAAIDMGPDNLDISHCSLIPQTPEQTQKMLDSCLYHKQPINYQILKGIVALRAPKNHFYLRLFKNLAREENVTVLVEKARHISPPTQLVWGEHDELIDKSGAEVLKKVLPNCERVDIIERCGHSVNMDRPGAVMKTILVFRGEYDRKNV
ncbi:monoacylglycerol lipase ABHD6-like [Haliotis rubra]|uniref:monoacylglycerol lipase ABHD6-like n=1 Tax=Haliotis rubra TaxID=36100 RepID=UPI001EE5151C|nr:monoacylglycerol lipase ABHD6-like [Haliotis rubra]XP_046575273.1 monoacylglycerol lipase ABHD6-like [Haliotis rubra]